MRDSVGLALTSTLACRVYGLGFNVYGEGLGFMRLPCGLGFRV